MRKDEDKLTAEEAERRAEEILASAQRYRDGSIFKLIKRLEDWEGGQSGYNPTGTSAGIHTNFTEFIFRR